MPSSQFEHDKNLTPLMQMLPQELRDQVFDIMLEQSPRLHRVTEGFENSPLLHLDTRSRVKFAQRYYIDSSCTFHDPILLREWVAVLPPDHRSYIEQDQIELCIHVRRIFPDLGPGPFIWADLSKQRIQSTLSIKPASGVDAVSRECSRGESPVQRHRQSRHQH